MSPQRRRAWLTSTILSGAGRLSIPLAASLATSLATSLAGGLPAHANPVDGQVVRGQASISQAGDTVTVDQSSRKAVIDWRGFDIAPGERTVFNQPGADAIVLNRVTGHDPSRIHGSIQAVGHVWLVNPNGVAFGPNAVVDVNGLLATTADIANDDFMAGRFDFATASPVAGASVVNQGSISVGEKGLAALVAPSVRNDGAIVGQYAQVVLAGAETFAIDFAGDGLLNFAAGQPVSPSGEAPLVANSGRIDAPGGAVLLSAHAADAVVDNVITMDGVIQARTAHLSGSTVVLAGGDQGTVTVTGRIDASGPQAGRTGGRVEITGETVVLDGGALVDVSGAAGGGTVLVGGDFAGGGTLARATTTLVDDATIRADATEAGDGGRVILWADDHTGFAGLISARGGSGGGDGGFAEVSGKQTLSYQGFTDLRAPAGATGDLLLDPGDIIIDDAGSDPIPGAPVGGSDPNVTIASATIEAQLVGANVTLQAANDILVQSDIDTTGLTSPTGSLTLDAGNAISVDAAIALQNQTLTLDADNGITVNAAISTGGAAALNANADATGGGTLAINQAVSAGGALTLSGADGTIAAGLTLTGAGVTLTGATTAAGALTIDATGGTATINSALTATAGGGDVTIRADNLALNAALNNGTNTTTIERPAGGDLRIGSGAAAALTLDGTELGRITTDRLVLGNATVGTIFVGALSTSIPTVELVATTDINVDATSSFQSLVVRRADAGNILLGGAGGFSLPTGDLVPLSITDLTVITTDGSITAQTLTIMRPVTLDASANGGQVIFTGSAQTFASLDVTAGTVQVGTNLTTTTSDLIIESSAGTTITAGTLTSAGTLLFEGAGAVSSGALTLSSTGTMQFDAVLSTGGATLDITAADLAINAGGGLNAGAGRVTITPGSGGVGLGGGAGALSLADAEIDRITAGVLDINTAGGGGIAVDGVTTGLTLELTAASGTSFSGAASSFGALDLTAAGTTSFAVDVSTNGDLVLGSTVTASADVTLAADADDNGVGDLTLPAGGTLNAGGNALTLRAADLGLGAGATVTAGSVTLSATNGRDVALNTAGSAFDADLGQFTTSSVTATTGGAGDITLGAVSDAGLDLDVQAGGSVSLTADVTVNSFAATAPSGIALAAGLTVSAADGIALNSAATAAGGLTLTADTDADGGAVTLAGGLAATAGDVLIVASDLTVGGLVDNGANMLTIRPSQAGLSMGLAGTGALAVSAAELGNIATGTLVFGDTTAGTLTVGALAAAQTDQIGTVRLITGADIVFGGNATFQILDAQAETGIAVTGDLTTVAGDLALLSDVSGFGGGDLTLGNATLTAEADGTTVDLDAGSGSLSGGTVSLRAGGDLRLDQSLTVTGGLTLVADFQLSGNGNGTGSVIIDPGVTIAAGAGPVAITAADLLLDTTAAITGGSISLQASNDRSVGVNTTGLGFDVSAAEAARLTSASLTVTTTGAGGITAVAINEPGRTVSLQAGGDIDLSGATSADAFQAVAGGALAIGGAVDTTVGDLTLSSATGMTIVPSALTSAGGLTLSGAGSFTADGLTLTANSGVTFDASGTIATSLDVIADADSVGGGAFLVTAGSTVSVDGPVNLSAAAITIDGTLTSTGGLGLTAPAGQPLGLGAVTGGLDLTSADLLNLAVDSLTLSTSGAGGDVVVAGLDIDGAEGINLLTIDASGTVAFTTAPSDVNALTVTAAGAITVDQDVTAAVGDLRLASQAGIATAAGVTLDAGGALVLSPTGSAVSAAGALTLRAGAGITLDTGLTGAGALAIDADTDDDGAGTLTAGGTVQTSAGAIALRAADAALTGGLISPVGITLTASAGTDLAFGAATTSTLIIDGAELAGLSAPLVTLVTEGGGDITLNALALVNTAGIGDLVVQAGGSLRIGAAGVTFDGDLDGTALTGVAIDGDVTVSGGDLALVALGGDLSAATGVVATAGGGVTRLGAQAGAMALGDGVTLGGAGTLLLTAGAGISGAGGLTLNAADGFDLTAPLDAVGAVTINADADGDGSGALTLTGALAAGGDIDLLGSVIDVGATIDNGGATLRLRSAVAGASLGLAGGAGAFTVGSDALGRITTGTLVLGDAAAGAIAVGALDAGMMSGIGGLELVGAGGLTFDGPIDGGFDLAIDVGGDVTFAQDVGSQQRLGDVTFRNAGNVTIDGFFIAGALEITVAGDFTNTNQTLQADLALGLDVNSLLILNANSFEGFGAVAGITGQQAAVVADAQPRSNSYVLNGCIIGSLTNCFNFGVELPSTTLRFDFDKSRLFVAVQGDRELDEDSLFSNVGNEELW